MALLSLVVRFVVFVVVGRVEVVGGVLGLCCLSLETESRVVDISSRREPCRCREDLRMV